jgi:endonuclease/exonuclease/phosphatase family metal-dependent hydrolase
MSEAERSDRVHPRSPGARPALGATLLVALTVVLGGQLLRIAFPMLGWYLRDTVGVAVLGLLPYALGPFVVALALPLVIRLARPRGTLIVSATGLAAARIVEQFSTDPEVMLWAALAGIPLFLWVLAIAATRSRAATVFGIVLGLAVDTALRGLTGTVDLSWVGGTWPTVVVVVLAVALAALAVAAAGPPKSLAERGAWLGLPGGHTRRSGVSLAGIGPLLVVHWLVLQNQGWVATQTGWDWPAALALITVGNVGALVAAAAALPRESHGPLAALAGFVLLGVAALTTQTGLTFALVAVIGLVATGPYLAATVPPPDPTRPGGVPTALWVGVGGLLFVIPVFAYYAVLDLALPFGQVEVRAALGVLLALFALAAVDIPAVGTGRDWRPGAITAALLAVPVAVVFLHPAPDPDAPAPDGWPVTVMTYNLHSGYSVEGLLALERIAQVIEDAGADVVGLQEATRGWLMDGSPDVVAWLSRRLDMPHVTFQATTDDPLWGNAILSRYPFLDEDADELPRMGTLVRRGYQEVTLDLGRGELLHVFNTHLHHEAEDLEELHTAQLEVIVEAWDERERSVLIGDLNALPEWPQIEALLDLGWVDAWEVGDGPGYTWRADDPDVRIDYVLHTEDLRTTTAQVIATTASDHRPVVAVIERGD